MRAAILIFSLLFTGCAHQYSLSEIQQYDQAMKLSEAQGIDTQFMHGRLVEMLASYAKHPGEDPYEQAARQASQAMGIAAAASLYEALKPPIQPMPMGFGEFTGKFDDGQ